MTKEILIKQINGELENLDEQECSIVRKFCKYIRTVKTLTVARTMASIVGSGSLFDEVWKSEIKEETEQAVSENCEEQK